jgi:PQQ-like domain
VTSGRAEYWEDVRSTIIAPALARSRAGRPGRSRKVSLSRAGWVARWCFVAAVAVGGVPVIHAMGFQLGQGTAAKAQDGPQLRHPVSSARRASAPAVQGGLIFTTTAGGGNTLYALRTLTGVEAWSFTASDQLGSPAAANGVVYVGSANGKLL